MSASLEFISKIKSGGFSWNRTNDTKIFSLVLYQLSYEATKMAVRTGLEPVISRVTGERDNHYTNEPWLRETDLNHRPLGYEPSELPDCSIPRCNITNKVAEEKGFEPLRRFLDLPVFKTGPFNQTWVFLHIILNKNGAPGRSRTGTSFYTRRILSPVRLPIPPLRHTIMVSRWRFELQTP